MVHEGIAVRLDLVVQRPSDVADQANGHGAKTDFFLVTQSVVQERAEAVHVLDKFFFQRSRNGTNRGEHDIRHTRLGRDRCEDLEQDVHNTVRLGLDLDFQALNNGLQR